MSTSIKRSPIAGLAQPKVHASNDPDGPSSPAIKLDLMRNLRRRMPLAAGVAGGVFLLVLGEGVSRKPLYQAESLTYIEPLASKVLSDGTGGSYDSIRYDSYLQQQMQTAVRPDILAAAIEKLPPNVWQHPGEPMPSAVTRLQNSLKVERVASSYQLAISLSDGNPETAASVVNAVTNTYLEQGRKDEHAVIDQKLQLLGEERQRIQQMLDEDRLEQASLGNALGVANVSGLVGGQFDAQIAGVESQVAGAREARDVAAAQLASVQSVGGTLSPGLAAAAEELINTDTGLNSMKGTITARKAVLSTQMAGLTPTNPIFKQDEAEIADLDRSLDAMTSELRVKTARRLQDKMRADLQRTADVEGRLNAQLQHQTANATNAAPKVQRLAELTADLQRLNARFGVVDDAIRGLQLESNGPGSAHLSVAATVPFAPEASKRKLILLLALPLGFFAGLIAASVAGHLDPRIYSGSDVARVLGFLPIGVMPAAEEVSSRVMEEYTLRLAAGLQSAYRTSGAQSFVFTAASPTVQIGPFVRTIETVLSALGFKAIVMDASSVLRGAGRNQTTQRSSSRLVSHALTRTIEGVRQGYAAEEIERMKLKYDLLLIDAPPLLHSAETEYLSRCADATILVAESGVTIKPELFQSAMLLQQLNVAGVGTILQELHLKDGDSSFRAAVAAVERGSVAAAREPASWNAAPMESSAVHVEPTTEEDAITERAREERSRSAEVNTGATKAVREESFLRHNQGEEATVAEPAMHERSTPESAEPVIPAAKSEPVAAFVEENTAAEELVVEEQDPVGLWKELMNRRKVETPEAGVSHTAEETREPSSSRAPEPVLYFEDRLRSRKPAVDVVAESHAAQVQDRPFGIAGEGVPLVVSHPAQVPINDAVAPVQSLAVAESAAEIAVNGVDFEDEMGSAVSEAFDARTAHTVVLQERSVLESGTEAHGHPEADEQTWSGTGFLQAGEVFASPLAVAESATSDRMQRFEADMPAEPAVEKQETGWEAASAEGSAVIEEDLAAPASSTGSPLPKREATPARMEWFTLRFRGTSERVLRLVPGEEGSAGEDEAVVGTADASAEHLLPASAAEPTEIEPVLGSRAEGLSRETERAGAATEEAVSEPVIATSDFTRFEIEDEILAEREYRTEALALEPIAEVEEERVYKPAAHAAEAAAPQASHGEDWRVEGSVADSNLAAPPAAAPPADAAPVQEAAPVERTKINRWAVQDHAPGEEVNPAIRKNVVAVQAEPQGEPAYAALGRMGQRRQDHAAVASADRFAPALLVEELRRRSTLAAEPVASAAPLRNWSRRSVSAPVEERLEPKAQSMTRRWQMLSRFDQTVSTPSDSGPAEQGER